MKKISTFIAATVLCLTTASVMADSCPNLLNKTFYSASSYNTFRTNHLSEYNLPSTNELLLTFPLKFGAYEYIYLKHEPSMNKQAPFYGNPVTCVISAKEGWLGQQNDLYIKIHHNVKTTSSDWDFADDDTAECNNPDDRQNSCTFEKLN